MGHLTVTYYNRAEDKAEVMAVNNRDDGKKVLATNNSDVHGNEELGGEGDDIGLPPLWPEYAGPEADAGAVPQGGGRRETEAHYATHKIPFSKTGAAMIVPG